MDAESWFCPAAQHKVSVEKTVNSDVPIYLSREALLAPCVPLERF